MKYKFLIVIIGFSIFSCQTDKKIDSQTRTQVEIITTKGTILVELYNETPKHRDNFIKLVNEGFYDSLLWHRVIDDFVIQTGDAKTKVVKTGQKIDYVDYLVPAEINDSLFHKRGTLSAAHDGNPELSSSGTEFVIIHRGPASDTTMRRSDYWTLEKSEEWINERLAIYHTYQADSNAVLLELAKNAYQNKNYSEYGKLRDSIISIAKTIENPDYFKFPGEHLEHYLKYGGVPWNDKLYTVFGEVIIGMDVVDSIAETDTNENDRPIEKVRIKTMRIKTDANAKYN